MGATAGLPSSAENTAGQASSGARQLMSDRAQGRACRRRQGTAPCQRLHRPKGFSRKGAKTQKQQENLAKTAAALPPWATLCVGLSPVVYICAATSAAAIDGRALADVVCFEPGELPSLSLARLALAAAMTVGAVGTLFVAPGLLAAALFRRWPRTSRCAGVWSFAANSAALPLIFFLLRNTVGVDRLEFAAAWLLWTAALLLTKMRLDKRRAGQVLTGGQGLGGVFPRKMTPGAVLLALAVMLAAVVALFPEQFRQCFNEDGTETRQLALSLRQHLLPYWELETRKPLPGGRLGTVVVNPSLVNSYWTSGLQLLLGDNELPTRLPYWIWWFASFLVMLRMIRPRRQAWRAALPLSLLIVLVAVLFTFYVGYNPYMADIANPGVTDALFIFCMFLAFDSLRRRARWAWTVSMLLATLVLYAAPVMLAVMLPAMWFWKPIPRRETIRWGLTIGGALAAVAVFYVVWGWREGTLPVWVNTFDIEYLQNYLSEVPRRLSIPLFFGYFLLGCGGIAALGLIEAFRRDAWQRTVATTAILYLAIALNSGFKNLHFLAPLLLIPMLLFLMPGARPANGRRLAVVDDLHLDARLPGGLLAGRTVHIHAQSPTRPTNDHCRRRLSPGGRFGPDSLHVEGHRADVLGLRSAQLGRVFRAARPAGSPSRLRAHRRRPAGARLSAAGRAAGRRHFNCGEALRPGRGRRRVAGRPKAVAAVGALSVGLSPLGRRHVLPAQQHARRRGASPLVLISRGMGSGDYRPGRRPFLRPPWVSRRMS